MQSAVKVCLPTFAPDVLAHSDLPERFKPCWYNTYELRDRPAGGRNVAQAQALYCFRISSGTISRAR